MYSTGSISTAEEVVSVCTGAVCGIEDTPGLRGSVMFLSVLYVLKQQLGPNREASEDNFK